jgi:hypothetical protein
MNISLTGNKNGKLFKQYSDISVCLFSFREFILLIDLLDTSNEYFLNSNIVSLNESN